MIIAVWAQTVILAVTAFLVWRYAHDTRTLAKETAGLGRQMVRQNDITLRPYLVPILPPGPYVRDLECKLTNIGVGAALNVEVQPLRDRRSDEPEGEFVYEFRFTPIPYLGSGQASSSLDFERFLNGKPSPPPDLAPKNFLPMHGQGERTMRVLFQDVEGTKYECAYKLRASAMLAGACNVEPVGCRKL
jgi:hypothetical protein